MGDNSLSKELSQPDQEGLNIPDLQLKKMRKLLVKYLHCVGNPKTSLQVKEGGQVGSRAFIQGMAIKELDGLWMTPDKVAKRTLFCALEVAYQNEGIDGLVIEMKLWAQACKGALHFVGLFVTQEKEDIRDNIAGFVVILGHRCRAVSVGDWPSE